MVSWRDMLRMNAVRVALAASALVGIALAFLPLVGSLGVESALVLGIVLPPVAAGACASLTRTIRSSNGDASAAHLLSRALLLGSAMWVLAVAVVALNDFRLGSCAPFEGLAFEVLGPGFGIILAAVVGCALGHAAIHARLAVTVAALVPVAGYAFGVLAFYRSPAIFVYSHFGGFFPGTIYDEGISIAWPYVAKRLVTASWIGACGALVFALHGLRGAWLTVAALTLGAVLADAQGDALGTSSSAAHIEEVLGKRVDALRCSAVVPRELDPASARRLAEDCDFRIAQSERWLGVTQRAHVTAFFFRDAEEKRRLMGAEETFVAKPWRNEVYLQLERWPHPVLAHEIAHVVAGNVGPGPFHVAGGFGGWLPNPGLIEGAAVAMAWTARDELTPHEWAAAMVKLGVAPSLRAVMGTSFLAQSGARAYTVAGSFFHWVYETRGAATVRALYASGDVAGVMGRSLDELERAWRAYLASVSLSARAMELARVRFARGGIFSAVCPHRVAALQAALAEDVAAGDHLRAVATCRDVLSVDPHDQAARVWLVSSLSKSGRLADATRELGVLRTERAPQVLVFKAQIAIADGTWRAGQNARAKELYRELRARASTVDDQRNLDVKLWALEHAEPAVAALVRELLIRDEPSASAGAVAVHFAREIDAHDGSGLGAYLEARQLAARERFDLALPLLQRAEARGLPIASVATEARRMRGLSELATGEVAAAERTWRLVETQAATEAQRNEARDFLDRVARMRQHQNTTRH